MSFNAEAGARLTLTEEVEERVHGVDFTDSTSNRSFIQKRLMA